MAREAQGSAVVDPLVNYWGLSLFPQTSGVLPDPSKPYNPDVDLDAIHSHLRSMALGSPSKLLKQAKSIIDSNPELANSELFGDSASYEINDVVLEEAKENPRERRPALGSPSKLLKQVKSMIDSNPELANSEVFGDSASYEINDAVLEEAKENPRERRPALGHKRARFSLKPNRNHPTEILKPSLDIDNLKDPEEFFMAHERLENAKREIQKQMGNVLFEANQNNTFTNVRQRRPGLLGNNQRRSVRYKHRYSIETSDNKENVSSYQETFESGGIDPVGESPEKAEAYLASLGSELADSSAMKENNLNNILDELLYNGEDLEEGQAITLLQESLQIKPIVLQKLSFPDLPDNLVTELKTFGGNLSKPRKPLMNIDNLLERNHVTPQKPRQNVGSLMQQLETPTPPKSPFALLPSLQRHLSQLKSSVDPFSALDCEHLSTRNSSQSDMTQKGHNLVDSGKPSDKLNEPLIKEIESSVKESARNFVTIGKSRDDNSREPAFGSNIDSNESHVDKEVDALDKVIDNIVSKPNPEANEPCKFKDTVRTWTSTSGNSKKDNSTKPAFGTDVDSNKSHVGMMVDDGGSDVANRFVDDTISRANYETNEPCKFMEDTVRTCAGTYENSKEDNSTEPAFGINVDSNISHVDMEVNVGHNDVSNQLVDDTISWGNFGTKEPCKFKEDTVRTRAVTSGDSKEDNSTEPAFGINVDSNISRVDLEVDVGDNDVGNRFVDDTISRENYGVNEPCKFNEDTVRTSASTSGNTKEDNSTEPSLGTNVDSNISHVSKEIDVESSDVGNQIVQDTISRANEPCEFVDKMQLQEVVASEQTDHPDFNLVNPQADQSRGASFEANSVDGNTRTSDDASFEANSVDGNTRTSDDASGQCLQVQGNTEDSQVPDNEQRKVKSRKRKDRGLSKRQSLAVAGTSWESGVRRSTRIRSRPLEYWKGERPVYGRIHESLATVIGVKCISPGTADGKPTMKVKSYVAEKYKELLELASQY